jgi:hypothetical protein
MVVQVVRLQHQHKVAELLVQMHLDMLLAVAEAEVAHMLLAALVLLEQFHVLVVMAQVAT